MTGGAKRLSPLDPDALWSGVRYGDDLTSRAIAATDLLVWLVNGGAVPTVMIRNGEPMPEAEARVEITEECQRRIFDLVDRFDAIGDAVPKDAIERVGAFVTAKSLMGDNVDPDVIHEVWAKNEHYILRTDDVRSVAAFGRFVGECERGEQ